MGVEREMETLSIGDIRVTWLNGGNNHLDGGAMFGVVPKPLWSKKYPVNDKNQIELRTDPLLIQVRGKNILIDSGIGKGKLNEKQLRNFGVTEESDVLDALQKLGLSAFDIDKVLMTHLHFDHASGLTVKENDAYTSVFPKAKIYVSEVEWNEMRHPNIRSRNTYWKENWEAIQQQVITFNEEIEVLEGINMFHTGGHSDGHAVILLEDGGEQLLHMGDLLATHAHANILWVMAYDDYPMTSVAQKQLWTPRGIQHNAWFSFYHDAYYRAVKWNDANELIDKVERKRS